MDLSDEDLQLPGPRPSSTPLYSLGSLQLEVTPTTNTMSKTDSTPTFIVTTPSSDADGGSHSSEEELEEINKTTPPLLPNSSSSSSLLSATPPGMYHFNFNFRSFFKKSVISFHQNLGRN